jgi:hypothetical protein
MEGEDDFQDIKLEMWKVSTKLMPTKPACLANFWTKTHFEEKNDGACSNWLSQMDRKLECMHYLVAHFRQIQHSQELQVSFYKWSIWIQFKILRFH